MKFIITTTTPEGTFTTTTDKALVALARKKLAEAKGYHVVVEVVKETT